MQARGKFIVLEGIDGSGKGTQVEALAQALARRGTPFARIGFPNYEGFYGKLVAQFLNGEFGPLSAVDPHFSALLYAGDRLESKPAIEAALAAGKILLADRYVASNLAHQGARTPVEKRGNFLAWLKQLEYEVHALPLEDLVVYLRVPVAEAHRLVGQKAAREYTAPRPARERHRAPGSGFADLRRVGEAAELGDHRLLRRDGRRASSRTGDSSGNSGCGFFAPGESQRRASGTGLNERWASTNFSATSGS